MRHTVYSKNGFSLIELVVVIVILGLLAVTVVPKYIDLTRNSKAAILESIGGSMASGLQLIYSSAFIKGQHEGTGLIQVTGEDIPLYNGYPSVRGRDSFEDINIQVKAWLEIDTVDRDTANSNRDAAVFFTDKSTRNSYIYIFFTDDYDQKSTIKCHVRYENPIVPKNSTPLKPVVTIETSEC
jgi:MSHA pilin protein MshA